MSDRPIYCPRCGTKRVNMGVFCMNCGTKLVNVGGSPGALSHMPVVSYEDHIKNNTLANMTSVGYSTWWQTYGLERKIVTISIWSCVLLCFVGVGVGSFYRPGLGYLLAGIGFFGIFLTAFLSSLRKQNREQIRRNGIVYKGRIKYVRNPVTGEYVDSSTLDIHYLHDEEGQVIDQLVEENKPQ